MRDVSLNDDELIERVVLGYKFEGIHALHEDDRLVGHEVLSKIQYDDWLDHDLQTLNFIDHISSPLKGLVCINVASSTINSISDEMMSRAATLKPGLVIEWVEAGCGQAALTEAAIRLRSWRNYFNIRISIDDMGKGQDGIERFLLANPDYAKIEGSILHGARVSPSYRKALKMICSLCRDENVPTVIEWIETPQDLDIALACGGIYGQGYYFKG